MNTNRNTYRTLSSGTEVWVDGDGLAHFELPDYDDGPTCSICDALGHGYPGGRPCPLEDRGWDDGFDEWEERSGVRALDPQWVMA